MPLYKVIENFRNEAYIMRDILVLVIKNQAHSELETEMLKVCKKSKNRQRKANKKATSGNPEVAFNYLIISILATPTRLWRWVWVTYRSIRGLLWEPRPRYAW